MDRHLNPRLAKINRTYTVEEVAALNAARIAGKSDHDIRALVTQLEAARTAPPRVSQEGQ